MRSVRLERIGRAYSVVDAKRFALHRAPAMASGIGAKALLEELLPQWLIRPGL
jgi:hypothetical protein